ncbi:MAG: restriction endonuclease subunit S [Paludibacteraceae bacterium]|nr:restriction endonuclease subunit S [Paludibacteraceae bacterium]
MNEWKKVKLGELYEVHNGLSKGRQFFGTGFPFLTFSNVFNNWFLPDQLESLVQTTDKERDACSIKAGDVFITRTSETMDELGMSSVALKDYPNATYNGFTKRLRPVTDRVNPRYIGYYLRTPKFRGQFMAFSTMTTRASLANNDLLNMEVELPSMETQHRIATILSRYDSLIENYQKQIKLLEEAAQRLYKEWFIDLHFPGHENTKIVDGVPEGWEKKKLHDFAEVVMGASPKSEFYNNEKQGLPFHQGVGSYGTRFVDDNVYTTSITRLAKSNSILFSVRAPVGRLNITKNKIVIGRGLAAMNHKDGFQSFLFYMLKDRFFMDNIIGNGSIFASISKVELLGQEFIVPPMKTIKAFESFASKLDKKIESVDTQIRLLTEARDRLLPKLMSGEIEI